MINQDIECANPTSLEIISDIVTDWPADQKMWSIDKAEYYFIFKKPLEDCNHFCLVLNARIEDFIFDIILHDMELLCQMLLKRDK